MSKDEFIKIINDHTLKKTGQRLPSPLVDFFWNTIREFNEKTGLEFGKKEMIEAVEKLDIQVVHKEVVDRKVRAARFN